MRGKNKQGRTLKVLESNLEKPNTLGLEKGMGTSLSKAQHHNYLQIEWRCFLLL